LVLKAFEQGGIFIVPHLLWHGTSVFLVSSEGPSHSITSYDKQRDVEDLFCPDPVDLILNYYHNSHILQELETNNDSDSWGFE
jgi:hypothetical protein